MVTQRRHDQFAKIFVSGQMNQSDDAVSELLALAAHRCAPISLCLEALSATIHANSSNENLKTAASLIIERFPEETSVPVKIVELILGQTREVCPVLVPKSSSFIQNSHIERCMLLSIFAVVGCVNENMCLLIAPCECYFLCMHRT